MISIILGITFLWLKKLRFIGFGLLIGVAYILIADFLPSQFNEFIDSEWFLNSLLSIFSVSLLATVILHIVDRYSRRTKRYLNE